MKPRPFPIRALLARAAFAGAVFTATAAWGQDLGTDAQRQAGKVVYDRLCAQCHGVDGDGSGEAKMYFMPRPRDFTYGLFKIRTTPSGALPTDDDLKKVIREGMPYTGMPAWPELTGGEVDNLIYYLKTFNDLFADAEAVPTPIDIPKPPGYSDESAARGKELYAENKCADCHGEHGRGNGKSAPTLTNDWGEPIRPADLTKRWTFRGGASRRDIYRTFTTGLNGTPMPSYADLLAEEDRWHLVDYVYSLSRDEPEYATVVIAAPVDGEIDLSQNEALFETAKPALFPTFGQVIEPGRNFYPAVTAIEVRAVYSESEIAFQLTWNDMTAEQTGLNNPSLPAPRFDPDAPPAGEAGAFTDAVAVQTPSGALHGAVKPYFVFGDARNPVDLWFADMGKSTGELYMAWGSQRVDPTGEVVERSATWEDGQWNVALKWNRVKESGPNYAEGSFTPVAFSIWDGAAGDHGNRRALTSWYHVYIEPSETESPALPMAKYAALTLLVELGIIGVLRRKASPDS